MLVLFVSYKPAYSQYEINENIIASTVYLEFKDTEGIHFGSGVLLRDTSDWLYVVTARHVICNITPEGCALKDTIMYIGFPNGMNYNNQTGVIVNLKKIVTNKLATISTVSDLAVITLGKFESNSFSFLKCADVKELSSDSSVLLQVVNTNDMLGFEGSKLANDVIVVGYPNVLGSKFGYNQFDKTRPLIRKGAVAGKNISNRTIIIDSPAYGGNSGGPVWQLLPAEKRFKIIGIVSEYIPSDKEIIDNSGYLVCVPIDEVHSLISKLSIGK